mmetsp:Transcript_26210/g.77528  ORF Transcript_26210/g.77528 Transcript_26210/m.77528 type:complete len:94 (-) Transcript_26210:1033-1314(-)
MSPSSVSMCMFTLPVSRNMRLCCCCCMVTFQVNSLFIVQCITNLFLETNKNKGTVSHALIEKGTVIKVCSLSRRTRHKSRKTTKYFHMYANRG